MFNTIKESLGRLSWLKTMALACLCMSLGIIAHAKPKEQKTLLIINSYHEDEAWANNVSQPISLYVATLDSVRTETVFMNNSAVKDLETYNTVCDNIFAKYADKHPDYLVLLGNFAFTLRDRIKQEWGNIPFLLISRIETFGPLDDYLTGTKETYGFDVDRQIPIASLRNKYNFTAVIVSDFGRQTIDLMMALNPNMDSLVFASDMSYINKVSARTLQSILSEKYPSVGFHWLKASPEGADTMLEYMSTRDPNTGFLISSWVYEVDNTRGIKVLTNKDLSYISASANPIFSLREAYMSAGAIGGAFPDNASIREDILFVVKSMIDGNSLYEMPFLIPERERLVLNHRLLTQYGISPDRSPMGTIFINKPQSYWEKYWILIVLAFLGLLFLISFILFKNNSQKKQIHILERHKNFVQNMPMPYSKVTLLLDRFGQVEKIYYEIRNSVFDTLLKANAMPDNPDHLFTNEYLTDIVKRVSTTNELVTTTHRFRNTNTYYYFVFVPVKIDLRNKDQNVCELDVFAIDITKDHRMEQKLKDQAITLDIAMEMAKLMPWQWDAGSNLISIFSKESKTGIKNGEDSLCIGMEEFLAMLPKEDSETLRGFYDKILRGEITKFDLQYRQPDKKNPSKMHWFENHGAVTDFDSDGRPLRVTGSVQDITERKQQEDKISAALAKAKESDLLKSAFLANMSHEIRTPLNAIVGFSNLLTRTDNMQEKKEYAEIINHNNDLLLNLINDVLDLAKIESNTIQLNYDVCDIKDMVDSIGKTMSIRIPKNVRFNVVHYSDTCVVRADSGHVTQILINLLTNATKFTKKGSITLGYEVLDDEGKIYFFVKDTGIGIKAENIDKVFNRFVKLNNFVQGTGLGLAICRTLVEKMGGEIGVESAGEGRGSRFWFTIPYMPQEAAALAASRPADTTERNMLGEMPTIPAAISTSVIDTNTLKQSSADPHADILLGIPDGLTVLVAEDNPSNFWLMERLLQDKFKIFHAENGQIAIEMFKEHNPDLVIMDINMPVLDGYGSVEGIRKLSKTVPIVAATAYAFASDRMRILSSGFDAYVSKPVSATNMYEAIVEAYNKQSVKAG